MLNKIILDFKNNKELKNLILNGDVEQYKNISRNAYKLYGHVIHGNARGQTVGMPTANIKVKKPFITPKHGVYATISNILGQRKMSLTNVGTRPSADSKQKITVETHIIDFNQDIYNCDIELEFCFWIRDIIKFNNIQEVKNQVDKDIENSLNKLRKFL